jgi:hypothetical protein
MNAAMRLDRPDLAEEFGVAACEIGPQEIAWLKAQGVPAGTLYPRSNIDGRVKPRVGLANIEPLGGGFYQRAEHGKRAFIMPASGSCDSPTDLIAWCRDEPGQWWRRLGAADLLNETAIEIAEAMSEPLTVHVTPLDWLRGGGRGVVVLDWRANLRAGFSGVRRILAADHATAQRLNKALRSPPDQWEIRVRQEAHNGRAA